MSVQTKSNYTHFFVTFIFIFCYCIARIANKGNVLVIAFYKRFQKIAGCTIRALLANSNKDCFNHHG